MNKFVIAAAFASTFALAAPAFADTNIFDSSSTYVEQGIAAQGYNVLSVEEWGDLVVATVKDDAGHLSFKYFNPGILTLAR